MPWPRFSLETRYSLRLVHGEGIIVQKDDTLLSGWFPLDQIPPGQPLLGAYPLEIPLGVLPGAYRLQLAVYEPNVSSWPLADGSPVLDLGVVEIPFTPAGTSPGTVRFEREIALDKHRFTVSRVRQGKGFGLQLLWQTLTPPAVDYTLLVSLVDEGGRIWREWRVPTTTSAWQARQQVRQQIDLTIPAEAPTGEDALSVHLGWVGADGEPLPVRRWLFPAGQMIPLGSPRILPKEGRVWEPPPVQTALAANFADKATLIGYDLPESVTLSGADPTPLPLTLYWQGRGDMREVYYTFVHVVNSAGEIVAQKDGVQANGKQPTTSWARGRSHQRSGGNLATGPSACRRVYRYHRPLPSSNRPAPASTR